MNTPEGALSVSRRIAVEADVVVGDCAARVKYADHGVRLPRVAGREGSANAKEPLAGPHIVSVTLSARASTPRCRKSGAGFNWRH